MDIPRFRIVGPMYRPRSRLRPCPGTPPPPEDDLAADLVGRVEGQCAVDVHRELGAFLFQVGRLRRLFVLTPVRSAAFQIALASGFPPRSRKVAGALAGKRVPESTTSFRFAALSNQ